MNRREMISGLAGMLGLAGTAKAVGALEHEPKPLGWIGATETAYSRTCSYPLSDRPCRIDNFKGELVGGEKAILDFIKSNRVEFRDLIR